MATQKELLDNANAVLLKKFAESDLTLNALGIGTAAITQGFVGKVDDIRFDAVTGTGISARQDAQQINVPGMDAGVTIAEEGQNPASLFLMFEGGVRKLAIPALLQSPKSKITLADGSVLKCNEMSGKQWFALIGKTIKCEQAGQDDEIMIPRVPRFAKPGADLISRAARYYEFTVQRVTTLVHQQ